MARRTIEETLLAVSRAEMLYECVVNMTETLEGDDHLGADMFYLTHAILNGTHVDFERDEFEDRYEASRQLINAIINTYPEMVWLREYVR